MKLLGFKIIRTGSLYASPSEHTVWSGFTRKEVSAHKQFVQQHVYNHKFDGEMSFEDVESDVVIFEPGMYRCECGATVEICHVKGRDCYGYTGHANKRGKWRRTSLLWFYVNGQAFAPNTRKIVEKIQ